VLSMCFQISPGLEVMIVKIQIQVMSLKVDKHQDTRDRTRELAKAVQGALGLKATLLQWNFLNRSAAILLRSLLIDEGMEVRLIIVEKRCISP